MKGDTGRLARPITVMRQTTKYTRGIELAKKLGAKVRAGTTSHEALYDTLEGMNYWWKAESQEWTNEAKPQRGNKSSFPIELAGSNEQLVQMRVIAGEQYINPVLNDLKTFCESRGWTFLQLSDAYTADNGGVRVYLSFVHPKAESDA